MKNIVRILSLVLAAMMLCGMVGTVASAEGVVELTIPHYKAGENVGAVFSCPRWNASTSSTKASITSPSKN